MTRAGNGPGPSGLYIAILGLPNKDDVSFGNSRSLALAICLAASGSGVCAAQYSKCAVAQEAIRRNLNRQRIKRFSRGAVQCRSSKDERASASVVEAENPEAIDAVAPIVGMLRSPGMFIPKSYSIFWHKNTKILCSLYPLLFCQKNKSSQKDKPAFAGLWGMRLA